MGRVLTRITTDPNSPMVVRVDQADGSGDAGLTRGGSFTFYPAGQADDSAQVSDHAARVIMGDPSLAPHFVCSPPLEDAAAAPQQPAAADQDAVVGE